MKDNELIAEFMGLELTTDGISDLYYTEELNKPRRLKHIEEYHTSWDWLMSVVGRINNLLSKNRVEFGYMDECLQSDDIETRYQAVVEFIKWYNTKKQIKL